MIDFCWEFSDLFYITKKWISHTWNSNASRVEGLNPFWYIRILLNKCFSCHWLWITLLRPYEKNNSNNLWIWNSGFTLFTVLSIQDRSITETKVCSKKEGILLIPNNICEVLAQLYRPLSLNNLDFLPDTDASWPGISQWTPVVLSPSWWCLPLLQKVFQFE